MFESSILKALMCLPTILWLEQQETDFFKFVLIYLSLSPLLFVILV